MCTCSSEEIVLGFSNRTKLESGGKFFTPVFKLYILLCYVSELSVLLLTPLYLSDSHHYLWSVSLKWLRDKNDLVLKLRDREKSSAVEMSSRAVFCLSFLPHYWSHDLLKAFGRAWPLGCTKHWSPTLPHFSSNNGTCTTSNSLIMS